MVTIRAAALVIKRDATFATPASMEEDDDESGILLGFARVLSGVVTAGQSLHFCTTMSEKKISCGEGLAEISIVGDEEEGEGTGGSASTVRSAATSATVVVYPHVMMGAEYHAVQTAEAGACVCVCVCVSIYLKKLWRSVMIRLVTSLGTSWTVRIAKLRNRERRREQMNDSFTQ